LASEAPKAQGQPDTPYYPPLTGYATTRPFGSGAAGNRSGRMCVCARPRSGRDSISYCLGGTPIKRLPILVASGSMGDPGLEIGLGGVRVIVLVIPAVIPVVHRVRSVVGVLPLVVDVDVVVSLGLELLLLVLRIPLVAPRLVIGLRGAVIIVATRFAIVVITIGIVVLPILITVCSSARMGDDRRSHEHHCPQQRQKQLNLLNFFSSPKSPYRFFSDG
jgi:hypothetical protein